MKSDTLSRGLMIRAKAWAWSSGVASFLLIQFVIRRYFTPEFFFFDPFAALFFFGLFALTYISITVSVILNWRKGPRTALVVPLAFLVVTTAVAVLYGYLDERRSTVPVIFSAYYDGDYNGTGINLRVDGSYEAIDGVTFGGDILYGDYRLSGDTIVLGKEHFRFGDAHWRFGRYLLLTDSGVVCFSGSKGEYPCGFVMRVIQDDRAVMQKTGMTEPPS